jgi:hypothetical protein
VFLLESSIFFKKYIYGVPHGSWQCCDIVQWLGHRTLNPGTWVRTPVLQDFCHFTLTINSLDFVLCPLMS